MKLWKVRIMVVNKFDMYIYINVRQTYNIK